MSGFLVKHFKGKNKLEIHKTKFQKHVERKLLLRQNQETSSHKETDKKGRFFWAQENREERCPFLYKSCRQRKNIKRKVNEKGGNTR